jgi:type IV secretion system protein VirB4
MLRNSPPLFYAQTTGATPFRFHLHVGDLGHTLMVGPPGAGKSTFLGLVTAQWFRYPRAQVFAFDKGYSLFALTRAAGGDFYDIGGDKTSLAFCPLKEIDSDGDVAWAVDWLEGLCVLQDFKVTPRERNALTEAVKLLQNSPTRTLTELCANVQDTGVREALQYYTLAGPMGILLDADQDMLTDGRFLTFETENLMQLGEKAVVAVLLYLPAPCAVPRADSGMAEDAAQVQRRGADGDTEPERYLQLADSRCGAGVVPDEGAAAECGSREPFVAAVL